MSQMVKAAAEKTGGQSDDTKSGKAGSTERQSQSTANAEKPADQEGEQSISKFSKSGESSQQTTVDGESQDMIITFSPNSISVTDQTAQIINSYIDKQKDALGVTSAKVVIQASDNPTSPSDSLAREAELGRTLNVRNVLLDKKIAPDKITIQNVDSQKQNNTYDWVKIHVEK